MKYLISAIVLILIVVLPAGSYYYLKAGFDYRKASLEELKPKDNVKNHNMDLSLIQDRTTFLSIVNDNNRAHLSSSLENIDEQFNDTQSFLTLVLVDSSDRVIFTEKGLNVAPKSMIPSNMIADGIDQMLIDTGGYIRHYYNSSIDDINTIVEHIAIVLPRVKEKDIVTKKYESQ